MNNNIYFLDQEFIEGIKKPFFNKNRHFIDLVSIGLVAGDGREYYALCSEYNYDDASLWVKENVITPIYEETVNENNRQVRGDSEAEFGVPQYYAKSDFHEIYGKTRSQIANEVDEFINPTPVRNKSVFYGYYADYDWVLFCSLFGTMMDLPAGYPMYCRDLKQMLDEKAAKLAVFSGISEEEALARIKLHPNFPKQLNEHHALADARWNRDLYNFLQKL